MTQIIIILLLTFLLLPLPLIITSVVLNRKELYARGMRRTVKDMCMAIATMGISLLTACATRPLSFLIRTNEPNPAIKGQPILMIHGLYHNKTAWMLIKPRLKRSGFCCLHTWSYNSFTTSYPELVLQLRKKILKLYAKNKSEKIILIGHSLGGLVIAGAISDTNISEAVDKVITLGTPFRGSCLAMVAPGHLGQSLHPKSSIFDTNNFNSAANIKKTAIISPVDEMVQPWKNLQPYDKSWEIISSPAIGHVAMLYSHKVFELLLAKLKL